MARFNDWEDARKELLLTLQREPSSGEIQQKMLEEDFNDSHKESPLVMAKAFKENIPGGNADGDKPSDYEKSQVERGKDIEFE